MTDMIQKEEFFHNYNSWLLLVCLLYCFLPTIALFILGDWFQLTRDEKGYISNTLGKLFIVELLVVCLIDTYYFSEHTFGTLRGKSHVISALLVFLFIVFLLYTQIKDRNVKIGIIISYTGIGVSFTTLVIEYYFKSLKKVTYPFLTGMIIYVSGYILICARLTAMWICNEGSETIYRTL